MAASASAASAPVITSFSPSQVRVGQTLTINGKNFRKGVKNNRVFFIRATDGKTVRARPSRASSTRQMTVVVPAAVTNFLTLVNNVPAATRFQLQLLSGTFSKKTAKTRSPIILPANTPDNPGGPGVGTGTPPPADCDSDGTPDSTDADDDNDGLPDTVEAAIKTDPCKKDTDADGVGDAYEYYASLDLNQNPNYAGKRPYPNPLDPTDSGKDFDGDGLTMAEEYAASVKFGTATSAPLTYSDGNQQSVAPANSGAMDLDNNGRITDDEKDADDDLLPNWVELAKGEAAPPSNGQTGCAFTSTTGNPGFASANIFTDCGAGARPNGNTFIPPGRLGFSEAKPDFLDADSDGDGVPDGQDDQDRDGVSNHQEIVAGDDGLFTGPQEPCDPNPQSASCERHTRA
ncbi:MAG: hypothetical protein QOC55_169 [Thermoleophilaceae bacterium]|nr:hypothetical protein [Thermoleophilaceae bacterium]